MTHKKKLLTAILFWYVNFAISGSEDYRLEWIDKMVPCDENTNKNVVLDMTLESDDEGYGVVSGTLDLKTKVDGTCEGVVTISKKLDNGFLEPILTAGSNVCDGIDDENCPWQAVYKHMRINNCPIEPGLYDYNNVVLKAEWLEDILTDEFVASYVAKLEMTCGLRPFSCFTMDVAIAYKN